MMTQYKFVARVQVLIGAEWKTLTLDDDGLIISSPLIDALQAVEWVDDSSPEIDTQSCPWCGESREAGHAPDCKRQIALGVVAE